MKLLFTPNLDEFKWCVIIETALIIVNYAICIAASLMTPRLRFHIHFKIGALFVFSQYFLFLTGRLIVLGYQSQILPYEGIPEDNFLIIASSWIRFYFIAMLMTMYTCSLGTQFFLLIFSSIPLVIERELSLYFIQDYATKRRLWIPAILIFLFVSISAISASVAVLEWIPILCGSFFLSSLPILVSLLFLSNYRRTWLLNAALKNRRPSRVNYTLAVRYQLEENLSFAEGIVFAVFVIAIVALTTYISFILTQLTIFSPETVDMFIRLFHLIIAADGPIITFGIFVHNAYFKNVAKEFFCGSPIEPERNEGDSYFKQLEIQWEEPTDKNKKINRQKTFLMRLLWLKEENSQNCGSRPVV